MLLQLERWSSDEGSSKRPCRDLQQQEQQQQQPDQQPPPYQYSLQLLVPPGQLELGRRLITAMYSSSPDLSDLEAPQLMQLVALAECYGVGKVVECAAAQLHKLTVQSMPFNIAASVFELPEACLQLEPVKKVQQAAADKLQQELGDLEVVWGDKQKQEQLLGLPFGALLQLLRDERTRVASEDTAVYTAQRWMKHNHSAYSEDQQQQQQHQQQLAGVLRLPHCTATYLTSLAGKGVGMDLGSAWVCDNSPRLLAELVALVPRSSEERSDWLDCECMDKAAWRLPPRPVSALTQLELSWDLPLAQLQERLAAGSSYLGGLACIWKGRDWWPVLDYNCGTGELRTGLALSGAPAFTTGVVQAQAVEGRSPQRGLIAGHYLRNGSGVVETLAMLGADREWPAAKASLQEQGLVHPDGCLHLRATITGVS
jgi:hypothetical protein